MHIAALFDLDGLLIDSERVIMATWLRVAQDLGRSLAEPLYKPSDIFWARDDADQLQFALCHLYSSVT